MKCNILSLAVLANLFLTQYRGLKMVTTAFHILLQIHTKLKLFCVFLELINLMSSLFLPRPPFLFYRPFFPLYSSAYSFIHSSIYPFMDPSIHSSFHPFICPLFFTFYMHPSIHPYISQSLPHSRLFEGIQKVY